MSSSAEYIEKLRLKIKCLKQFEEQIENINARLQEIANLSPVNNVEAGEHYEEFSLLKSELYSLQNEIAELPVLERELQELESVLS